MIAIAGVPAFKSEEDRAKYIDSIPDPADPKTLKDLPTGKTIDDLADEIEKNVSAALRLGIDPEKGKAFSELENAGGSETGSSLPPASPPVTPEQAPPQEQSPKSVGGTVFEKELFERRMAKMREDYEKKLQEAVGKIDETKSEYQKKLDELKPKEEEKSYFDPQIESQIKEKISRSKEIARKLKEADDMLSIEAQDLARESAIVSAEINDLYYAKSEAIRASAEDKIKAARELAQSAVTKITSREEAEKKRADETAAQEASRKKREAYYNVMDKFKGDVNELKDAPSYETMENEFLDFSGKLASIYYGEKLPEETTLQEREAAFFKYQQKTPALMEKMNEKGIAPPKNLEVYNMLSEVGALYRGDEYDPATGEWRARVNESGVKVGFPDVQSAYKHYRDKRGQNVDTILQAQRDAVEKYQRATDTRGSVVELSQNYQRGGEVDMSAKRAEEIMNDPSYNMDKLAATVRAGERAPDADKIVLNEFRKALKTLGLPDIVE